MDYIAQFRIVNPHSEESFFISISDNTHEEQNG